MISHFYCSNNIISSSIPQLKLVNKFGNLNSILMSPITDNHCIIYILFMYIMLSHWNLLKNTKSKQLRVLESRKAKANFPISERLELPTYVHNIFETQQKNLCVKRTSLSFIFGSCKSHFDCLVSIVAFAVFVKVTKSRYINFKVSLIKRFSYTIAVLYEQNFKLYASHISTLAIIAILLHASPML